MKFWRYVLLVACTFTSLASAQDPTQGGVLDPETPENITIPDLPAANVRHGIMGVWVRPNPKQDAAALMDSLKKEGFTDVFVEAFYHGMTIYPSAVAPMRPELTGRDLLNEYVEAASISGLRLHAWMEVFYWAPPKKYGVSGGLLEEHPEWETLNASGVPSSETGLHMGFADPALYDVRQTVYKLTTELAENYPEVGLHLDYLRYPSKDDFGYNPVVVETFQKQTGTRASVTNMKWYAFRQDVLAQVASGMSRAYHQAGGQGLVTAAVNAYYPLYKPETQQVWTKWQGVDVFIPMAYSTNLTALKVLGYTLRNRSKKPIWMGLQVGPGYPDLGKQINTLKPQGFSNYVVFGRR
ncbi:family 10 glycosylhydrolase [Deinococcus roseus]|uniref:Glycosyl hydrolase-like 10 domain-containing protein n=1 Tax=Deinococcus roseus TaxID=392414 RepID=A0ABQ2CVM8_9DEIO|nr:family 10 glycosylhydrolase [Deinococcus roseus]GGJ18636.1 hypothetical protein GCM10008938_00910 [Deinococcus roseus]